MITLILPIGPFFAALARWFNSARESLRRDSRLPDLASPPISFGYSDIHKLPSAEKDAIDLAQSRIDENDFEGAKHTLINAWLLLPQTGNNELAYLRLREGFVKLYQAKGETVRAEKIADLPTLLLDREVQWIVTHPDEQIGGSAFTRDESEINSEQS